MSGTDLRRAAVPVFNRPGASALAFTEGIETMAGSLRKTLESPAFKKGLGLSASASIFDVVAAVKAPTVGTPFHTRLRTTALTNGVRAGAVASGREAAWEASYDARPAETVASLAVTAQPAVAAAAEARVGTSEDPVWVLHCYAEAAVAAASAPASPPATLAASAGSAFPRVTAAGRRLEVEQGRVFYGDGTSKVEARATAEGAVQVRGWDGWVTVETFESLGGTVVDSVAASRLAQQMGKDA